MTTQPIFHDLVLSSGRVIDPESGLDAIRNVGISGGTVETISEGALDGRVVVDAVGLVVCPGFIDLHSHGQDPENYRTQVMDGVTTALELEVGTDDVDRWYADRGDAMPINYGVSVGHIPARMTVMNDPGGFLPLGDAAHRPASESEIAEITRIIERGLKRGALAVGLGMVYTPAASRWEVLETFKVAAQTGASCHIHLRGQGVSEPNSSIAALEEAIAASAITGAPLHVAHIKGTGQGAVPQLLQMIEGAIDRGLDVTTECYPYTAGMGFIESSFYDEGWQENMGITYEDLEWADTGERLTAESFARYRAVGGMVVAHVVSQEIVDLTVLSPLTMIATDGLVKNGKGHPRTAGSYSRILGHYVWELGALTISDAVRKMALMPAQRLEHVTPIMKKKGRVQVGCDADLVVFDPERVIDTATYQSPTAPPEGIIHVLVNGVPVVSNGLLVEDAQPGREVRAPAD